jgi:hypothetical protein
MFANKGGAYSSGTPFKDSTLKVFFYTLPANFSKMFSLILISFEEASSQAEPSLELLFNFSIQF